jgi:hypothetical protein
MDVIEFGFRHSPHGDDLEVFVNGRAFADVVRDVEAVR